MSTFIKFESMDFMLLPLTNQKYYYYEKIEKFTFFEHLNRFRRYVAMNDTNKCQIATEIEFEKRN